MDNAEQPQEEELRLPYPRKWVFLDRLDKTPIGLSARDFTDLYFAQPEGEHPWSYTLSELKREGYVRFAGVTQKRGENPRHVYVITPAGKKKIAGIRAEYEN